MSVEMQIFGAVVSIFVLVMFCVCGVDVRNYYRRMTVITGRQLVVRLFGAVFIVALLIKILYGIYWVDHRIQGADYFVGYWANCVGLTYLCLVFAAFDMYLTMKIRKKTKDVKHRIARRLNDLYRDYEQKLEEDLEPSKTQRNLSKTECEQTQP